MNINNVVATERGLLEVVATGGHITTHGTTTPEHAVLFGEHRVFTGTRGQCFAYCQARARGYRGEVAHWLGVLDYQGWRP